MDGKANPGGAIAAVGAGSVIAAASASGASLFVPVPFQSKIALIEGARIAGTTHICGIGEPGNLADYWAIKVYAGDDRIGFVPADCNEVLARLMDGGKALSGRLTGKEKVGTWNKLRMDVSLDD